MRRLWDAGHVHAFIAGGLFVFTLADLALHEWTRAAISAGFSLCSALVAIGNAWSMSSGRASPTGGAND